jgi:hypothetical protein
LVASSIGVLRSPALEPSSEALDRVARGLRAHIQREDSRASWFTPRFGVSLAAATIAALALIFMLPRKEAPIDAGDEAAWSLVEGRIEAGGRTLLIDEALPEDEPLHVAPRARLLLGRARLVSSSQAEIALSPDAIRLDLGSIAISIDPIDPPTPFVIETPLGRIEALTGLFRVRVGAEDLTLLVEQGEGRMLSRSNEGARSLHAGDRVHLARTPSPTPAVTQAEEPRASHEGRSQKPAPHKTPAAITVREPPAPQSAVVQTPPIPVTSREARQEDVGAPRLTDLEDSSRKQVLEARAALPVDAKKARAIAEAVLASKPSPALEAEAMMIQADAARRSGELTTALTIFERVLSHSAGEAFAEEAMLRIARIEVSLGDAAQAESMLSRARTRFDRGPLLAEREALASKLARQAGRIDEAADLLDAVPRSQLSLPLAEERISVAEQLMVSNPARARALVEPLRASKLPHSIRLSALVVLIRTSAAVGDVEQAARYSREKSMLEEK